MAETEEKVPLQEIVTTTNEKRAAYRDSGDSPFFLSVFNQMNAILGSGILGLAFAMTNLGIVTYTLAMVSVGCCAQYSVQLLLECCDKIKKKSYEEIGEASNITYNKKPIGRQIVALCIMIQNTAAMTSYMMIIKNQLPEVLQQIIDVVKETCKVFDPTWVVIITITFIVLPISLIHRIEFIAYFSTFSIGCMFIFTIVIVYQKFDLPGCEDLQEELTATAEEAIQSRSGSYNGTFCGSERHISNITECGAKWFNVNSDTPFAIPTMIFGFLCHTSVLPIYAELKEPQPDDMFKFKTLGEKMKYVSMTAVFLCGIIYSITALFGYLTFYSGTPSDLLLAYSYDLTNTMTLFVRSLVICGVILTLPLINFPTRKATTFMFFGSKPFSWMRHIAITVIQHVFCVILVLTIPDIKYVFGLAGCCTSIMLMFVLPALFWIRLVYDEKHGDKSKLQNTRIFAAIGIIFGGFSLCLTIYKTIADIWS